MTRILAINPKELALEFVKVNPNAKMFSDVIEQAITFYRDKNFDKPVTKNTWKEISKAIALAINEEMISCIDELVTTKQVIIGNVDGEDRFFLPNVKYDGINKIKKSTSYEERVGEDKK